MHTYIAILRGINVSGQKKVQMEDLRAITTKLGFKDVKTYIQSGNIIFKSEEKDTTILVNMIHQSIINKFNFKVPVIIREATDFADIYKNNPFLEDEKDIDISRLYVSFLSDIPDPELIKDLESISFEPDLLKIINREVYLYIPVAYGKTKLSNNYLESKLKVTATTRNWKTVAKLVELSYQL